MPSKNPDDSFLDRHFIETLSWFMVFAIVLLFAIFGAIPAALPLIPNLGFVHTLNLTALVSAGIVLFFSFLLDQSIAFASGDFDEWRWPWWAICSTRLGVIIMPFVWITLSACSLPWGAPIVLAVSCATPVVMLVAGLITGLLGLMMGRLLAKAMIAYGHRHGYGVSGWRLSIGRPCRVSALVLAIVYYRSTALVRFLCESGADPNQPPCYSGATPLVEAAKLGNQAMVSVLLAHEADVNTRDHKGRTPLTAALRGGHADVVDALLKAGASPNQHGGDFGTPIRAVVLSMSGGTPCGYDLMERLLIAGADPNPRRGCVGLGDSPLEMAARLGNVQAVEILLAYGADPNRAGEGGLLALTSAAISERREVIPLLVAAGADVNVQAGRHRRTAQYFINQYCDRRGEPRYPVATYRPRARRVLVGSLFVPARPRHLLAGEGSIDPLPPLRLYRFQLTSGCYTALPPFVKGSIADTTATIMLLCGRLASNPDAILAGKPAEILPAEMWLLVLSMLVTMHNEVWQQGDEDNESGWRPSARYSTLFDQNYGRMGCGRSSCLVATQTVPALQS